MDPEPVGPRTPTVSSADEMSCCSVHSLVDAEEGSDAGIPGTPREFSSSASDVGPPMSKPLAASKPSASPPVCSETMTVSTDAQSSWQIIADKCKARTWKRAFLPLLPQCTRQSIPGCDFCSLHQRKVPYGRCDNPVDPRVLAKVVASMKQKSRKSTRRWYCRYFYVQTSSRHVGVAERRRHYR